MKIQIAPILADTIYVSKDEEKEYAIKHPDSSVVYILEHLIGLTLSQTSYIIVNCKCHAV